MEVVVIARSKMDEDFKGPTLTTASGELEIKLDAVDSIFSTGTRLWMSWTETLLNRKVYLSGCRPAFVHQMNIVSNFVPRSFVIKSVYVPFYCQNKDEVKEFLFHYPTDFDDKKVLRALEFADENGEVWTIDSPPQRYFKFIAVLAAATKT